ncbi:two-component sensor histidine kinase [Serpentinicella alkaliphila]|nr:two-component sensor histidine kinase [Serpentinicella alkaliphila]
MGGLIVISAIVYFLKVREIKERKLREDYINQRDYLTELSISLEEKINELVSKQDVEVNLATLNERNRIAREIHDNVGHLLSSSILQIGAVIAISKDENTVKNLEVVRDTLNEGMNSIRESVHNLHDHSIDLYGEINKLIKTFTFCKIKLNYEIIGDMPAKAKYAIIAIIKEALSNVMKHSNGDQVSISLYEHPKLFQLIIYDNGNKKMDPDNFKGMGLESIKQRVASLNGIVNFEQSKGFKIFISFMK